MKYTITIVKTSEMNRSIISDILNILNSRFIVHEVSIKELSFRAVDILIDLNEIDFQSHSFTSSVNFICSILRELSFAEKFDYVIHDEHSIRNKKMLCSDMDSTMIPYETIDEIAKFYNKGEEMSQITLKTMSGELDFVTSFTQRLAMLSGENYDPILSIVNSNIEYNDGADILISSSNRNNIVTILLSGGFSFMSEKVAKKLGFSYHHGNILDVKEAKIIGLLKGINNSSIMNYDSNLNYKILDGGMKLQIMKDYAQYYNFNLNEIITIGDGSNDIDMLSNSGLGIAYKAKAIVKNVIPAQINHTDLTSILFFLGYSEKKW